MTDTIQETANLVSQAGASLLEVGVIGALLLLSLIANAVLVWALVRCWRYNRGVNPDYQ